MTNWGDGQPLTGLHDRFRGKVNGDMEFICENLRGVCTSLGIGYKFR